MGAVSDVAEEVCGYKFDQPDTVLKWPCAVDKTPSKSNY